MRLNLIGKRSRYFGSHAEEAWKQINAAEKVLWKQPLIEISKFVETEIPSVYLHRCIMKDYVGWHEGEPNRFVY